MPMAQIKLIELSVSIVRRPNQLAPLGCAQLDRLVSVGVGQRRWQFTFPGPTLYCLANCGCCVKMRVDQIEFVVVMLIWVLVAGGVVCVVHTRPQVRVVERLVLVIKPESVCEFLAHDEVSPCIRIIFDGFKVSVIQFDRTLCDVKAANPNLRYSEPAGIAVRGSADLYAPAGRPASL